MARFKTLHSVDKVDAECWAKYRNVIYILHEVFDRRFQDFAAMEKEFKLFCTPFIVDVECESEELRDLRCDSVLKKKYT